MTVNIFNKITSQNEIQLSGMLFGGFIWGSLSDIYGRKKTLIVAMFINALSGFASSLCQEKFSFMVLRFIGGLG